MKRGIHWFRRDLRLRDNRSLTTLADAVDEFLPVFILDPRLSPARSEDLPRMRFLLDCLRNLQLDLEARGVSLQILRGDPEELIPDLAREIGASFLSFGSAVTPFARRRDLEVKRAVSKIGVEVIESTDDTVMESGKISKKDGGHYRVYTPYRNAWWRSWNDNPQATVRCPRFPVSISVSRPDQEVNLSGVGGGECASELPMGSESAARKRLASFLGKGVANYAENRDRPDIDGTSRLSPYLKLGVISARECFRAAMRAQSKDPSLENGVGKWLDELIWREFYAQLVWSEPRIARENCRPEYNCMEWNDDPEGFEAWAEGRTGYPIVDAGMRQLKQSGWMHNRTRMIVASFLTKDLLIDWRRGEKLFMERLVDGDPASNNGGWQWSASTGSDAQPYFRIFNPVTQGQRCDPSGHYVKEWVPELRTVSERYIHCPWELEEPPHEYPAPIVDHASRRLIALERFKKARAAGKTSG